MGHVSTDPAAKLLSWQQLDTGEMLVTGASVTPEECTGMLEGYAIWLLKKKGRCLNVAD
jgi:hypothetical protein